MDKEFKIILNTGRTIQQGIGLEIGKISKEYFNSVNYIELNDKDAITIGAKENSIVRVINEKGSIVLFCRLNGDLPHGQGFIPYGLWGNQLFSSDSVCTGTPQFKGIPARVTLAETEHVLTLEELVKFMEEC